MNSKWTAGAFAAFLLTGCSGVKSLVKNGRLPQTINQHSDHGGFIEAIGIGAADPSLPTDTQRKALARDAAIVKAQYEMLAMIKGVRLSGGITVKRAMESDSDIKTRVDAMIRGADVVKSEFTSDNGCVVTLRLPKEKLEELVESGPK